MRIIEMSQTDNETVCINIWPEFHNNHIRGAIATSWPPAPAARRLLASSGANILVSWSRNPDRYDAIICLNGEILLSVKSSTNWLWSPPIAWKVTSPRLQVGGVMNIFTLAGSAFDWSGAAHSAGCETWHLLVTMLSSHWSASGEVTPAPASNIIIQR